MAEAGASAKPPYLVAALLCNDVLEEKDGRLSLVRLVTDVRVEGTTSEMPPITIPITGLISFNAGGKPGTYEVRLKTFPPDGKVRTGLPMRIDLSHDHFTVNLILKGSVEAKVPGVYWIAVLLDGNEVTRLPLNVRYVIQPTEQPPGAPVSTQERKTPDKTH